MRGDLCSKNFGLQQKYSVCEVYSICEYSICGILLYLVTLYLNYRNLDFAFIIVSYMDAILSKLHSSLILWLAHAIFCEKESFLKVQSVKSRHQYFWFFAIIELGPVSNESFGNFTYNKGNLKFFNPPIFWRKKTVFFCNSML